MTADRRAALVERMAREVCDAVNGAGAYDETLDIHQTAVWKPIASAALDLALEEAARECEAQVPQDSDEFTKGYRMACEENARNVRALRRKA